MLPWMLAGLAIIGVITFLVIRDATIDDRRRKATKRKSDY